MGIRTEYQAVITCDQCYDNFVDAFFTQKQAITHAHKDGWSIGKKITCPKCRAKNKIGGTNHNGKTNKNLHSDRIA